MIGRFDDIRFRYFKMRIGVSLIARGHAGNRFQPVKYGFLLAHVGFCYLPGPGNARLRGV
jgi:hypothetical protein